MSLSLAVRYICYLPAGRSIYRGLENAARGHRLRAAFSLLRSQFFTIRTNPKLVNNYLFFSKLSNKKNPQQKKKKTHASVTVTVVRDSKNWTTLRTNQIVGFVTVPAWIKNKFNHMKHKL